MLNTQKSIVNNELPAQEFVMELHLQLLSCELEVSENIQSIL